VGINRGVVWMFSYQQSREQDPQGTTVDIAARLCKMTQPQTLLCTEEAFAIAGGISVFTNASSPMKLTSKEFKEPLELRALAPTGQPCNPFSLEGHYTTPSEGFQNALRLQLEKKYTEALATLRRTVGEDHSDFHATVHAAELLLLQLETTPHKIDQAILREADELLSNAMCLRPHSSRVWLLFSRLHHRQFEVTRDNKHLACAVRLVTNALGCAQDGLNTGATIEAKTQLANYLYEHAVRSEDAPSHLREALELCDELDAVVNQVTGDIRKTYLVTRVLVHEACGHGDPEAEQKLNEALRIDPNYDKAHEARAELARRRRT
jgi:tetratricopeptide (TPR) repeat protein